MSQLCCPLFSLLERKLYLLGSAMEGSPCFCFIQSGGVMMMKHRSQSSDVQSVGAAQTWEAKPCSYQDGHLHTEIHCRTRNGKSVMQKYCAAGRLQVILITSPLFSACFFWGAQLLPYLDYSILCTGESCIKLNGKMPDHKPSSCTCPLSIKEASVGSMHLINS